MIDSTYNTDSEYGTYSVLSGDEAYILEDTWIAEVAGIEAAYIELTKYVLDAVRDNFFAEWEGLCALIELGQARGFVFDHERNAWLENGPALNKVGDRLGIMVTDRSGSTWRYWIERTG